MNALKTLKRNVDKQSLLFKNNIPSIRKEQKSIIETMLLFAAILVGLIAFFGIFVEILNIDYKIYVGLEIILLIMLALSKLTKKDGIITVLLYVFNILFLALTTYFTCLDSENSLSVTFIAALCILPIITIDRIERKIIVYILACAAHFAVIYSFKTPQTLITDSAVCSCVIFAGLVSSYYNQKSKMFYLDLYKKSDFDKRRDYLTGLYNRYELFDLIKNTLLNDSDDIHAMYMMDIDFYKQFNDIYGHIAGDECLKKIGKACLLFQESHKVDFYRYGGEEILAVGLSDDDCEKTANELLNMIRDLNIEHKGAPAGVVTVSIGYTADNSRYEKMIDKADKAMYKAKQTGRNKVVCFENEFSENI